MHKIVFQIELKHNLCWPTSHYVCTLFIDRFEQEIMNAAPPAHSGTTVSLLERAITESSLLNPDILHLILGSSNHQVTKFLKHIISH